MSLKSAAPAANAVQADTGALNAGNYDFDVTLEASDTVAVGNGLVIEHHNATNSATLNMLGAIPDGAALRIRNFAIAQDERIRVIAGTAAGHRLNLSTGSTLFRQIAPSRPSSSPSK